jgi:hypothetical protein
MGVAKKPHEERMRLQLHYSTVNDVRSFTVYFIGNTAKAVFFLFSRIFTFFSTAGSHGTIELYGSVFAVTHGLYGNDDDRSIFDSSNQCIHTTIKHLRDHMPNGC